MSSINITVFVCMDQMIPPRRELRVRGRAVSVIEEAARRLIRVPVPVWVRFSVSVRVSFRVKVSRRGSYL